MSLDPLAVALQGVGYAPEALALQGLARVELFVVIPGGGGASAGMAAYGPRRFSVAHDDDDPVVTQIHRQDDEVLTIIMLTVLRGDLL